MYIRPYFILALVVLIAACKTQKETVKKEPQNQEVEKTVLVEKLTPGLDLSAMDPSVAPGEDFFLHVNGKWMEENEIPADKGRWGSFDELRKNTTDNVLAVLKKAKSQKLDPNSDQAKAAKFYRMAMNTEHLNKLGTRPIHFLLDEIDAITSINDLQSFMERNIKNGLNPFYYFGVSPDARKSDIYAASMGPGALGLPDKDYYIKDDNESVALREKYEAHIGRMLRYIGYDEMTAKSAASNIVALEKQMAEPRFTKVQRRNPLLRYNKRSIDQINEMTPQINWPNYFKNIGAGPLDTVIVSQPKYMEALGNIFKEGDVKNWKHYLKWTVLNRAARYLSTEIESANFDFYGKVMRGTEEQSPRYERVLNTSNYAVGEALGKLYVEEYFPPEAKRKARAMVDNIIATYAERIRKLSWMTEETKKKALEKLSNFTVKIGYPDKWKDYSALEVKGIDEGGSYAGNMINVSRYNFNKNIVRIGKKVDKSEWYMAPQVVNAYYNPRNNEIVFPAAIMQPPFYNYRADEAVNYGGIGAVIGHEISHGFDDQGSRFDKDGNMNNWWTEADREAFEELNKALIAQYDAYEPLPGVHVNGAFTLGENIGDLGGINAAYYGLMRHFKKAGKPGLIDGYTPEQRFFLSWGTIWRGKYRDETLKTRIKTDPHAPAQYRAIGPLSNFDPFYEAFDIKPTDAMYKAPEDRIVIW